ncbi:MAG: FecR domain-containing protein [Rhodocyclaceae bacterium]
MCDPSVGELASIEGIVEVRSAGATEWIRASRQTQLCAGDVVAARTRSRATIVFSNGVLARLDEQTTVTITAVGETAAGELSLSQGALNVLSRQKGDVRVTTPHMAAQTQGGEFNVVAQPDETSVSVVEGRVQAVSPEGTPLVAAGASADAARDLAALPLEVRPANAVRWAIHYPQIISVPPRALDGLPAAERDDAAHALSEGLAGNYAMATAMIESVLATHDVPALQAYRANMLLAIGRFDEARDIIAKLDPERDANAAALNAIIRVATNDAAGSIDAASRAVSLDPHSSSAALALSYAWQAQRDLGRALDAATTAAVLDPNSALTWARRAEIELSMSHLDEGAESLERALAIEPDMPLARGLQGFSELLKDETDKAVALFNTAIERNSAEPLPWYGRGMALIRQGQLEQGRRDLEVAVMLDPTNAELRSYLARAYVDESRMQDAVAENDLARRLDPLSPTPWYFDALRKQESNDPIGALADAREAISRNDRRAVFRPSTLLDQDRATREANMSKSYEELGWYRAMITTAQAAVVQDPQSGSAHHFLASAYATGSQYEVARMSELLQAQLRQQPGQWPLPPQYFIAGLPILDGPRALSTEETSDLFERQPNYFAVSGIGGSHSTAGGSVLASHAWQSGQISAGYFNYQTDGWRAGSDFTVNATQIDLLQQLTDDTTVYGQIKHSERTSGDLTQQLAPSAAVPVVRRSLDVDQAQVGFRHDMSTDTQVLGNFSVAQQRTQWSQFLQLSPTASADFGSDSPFNSRYGELQLLKTWGAYSLQAGGGSFRGSGVGKTTQTVKITTPPIQIVTNATSNGAQALDNGYVYGQARLATGWTLHGGASYDVFHNRDRFDATKLSPKLGIEIQATPETVLRLAAYRSFAAPVSRQQSLTPTVFNGFSDMFDDVAGTRSGRLAVAVDQRLGVNGKAGFELSQRNLDVPEAGCATGPACMGKWRERSHRAYATWAPWNWLALSGEWRYDSNHMDVFAEAGTATLGAPLRVRTQQWPLRVWVRLSREFSTRLEVRQVRQDTMTWQDSANVLSSETFWLTNLSIRQTLSNGRYWWELAANNLFDQHFRYQDTNVMGDPRMPEFWPARVVTLRLSAKW